ncbi:MAG: glycosyltransferase family 2 protein [Terriglobales bacterium]
MTCVVLNWRGLGDTLRCLESLARVDYPALSVVVVDNGSGDGSADAIRRAFPNTAVIALPENRGFAGGNTAGIRHAEQAGAPYVWLLNNDAVADPGALKPLVTAAEADPHLAVVGSVLFDLDNPSRLQEWGGGWFFPWTGRFQAHARRPGPGRLAYISGASALMRIAALSAVGGLDTAYFLYGEDVDLCHRLRRAGWGLEVAAASRVLHKQWASPTPSLARDYYLNAAAVRTQRKHYGVSSARFAVGLLRRGARSLLTGRWRRARAVALGSLAGWRSVQTGMPYGPVAKERL